MQTTTEILEAVRALAVLCAKEAWDVCEDEYRSTLNGRGAADTEYTWDAMVDTVGGKPSREQVAAFVAAFDETLAALAAEPKEPESHCGCGEVFGELCQWVGARSEMHGVWWMPDHYRASHLAAGVTAMSRRLGGATHLSLSPDCYGRVWEAFPEWTMDDGK
jgi:hypothetical protein